MASQPQGKPRRHSIHEYKRSLHEKRKDKKRLRKHADQPEQEKPSEKDVSERTLKQLHTLGIQKFGSSPFSEHFNRWLFDVEAVISEFEAYPGIGVDEEFVSERIQIVVTIKKQLEHRSRQEAVLNEETAKLSGCKSQLAKINQEYVAAASTVRNKRNVEVKQLNATIKKLKTEQDTVIRLKTGFFRGISKKEREHREQEIIQQLDQAQDKLELALLDLKTEQKALREEYEKTRDPLLEQVKQLRKMVLGGEIDDSLEERWLACEELVDLVNNFLQRKAMQPK